MLWLVRHSMFGLDETAIKHNMIFYHWRDLPDLTKYDTKAKMKGVFEKKFPDDGPRSISIWYGQMWSFIRRIKIGDHAVLTRESSSKVSVGEVTGEYHYDRNIPKGPWHCRSVRWIERDIPRSRLPADIRQSLNAQLTVCKIDRDRAEERLLKSVRDTGAETNLEQVTEEMMESAIDPEKGASDRILAYIGENFRSHGFEKLVGEVLRAKGYTVDVTGRGGDGGVDILAGRGDLGFDPPFIAVQVK